jgi:CMP-N-acetylneuraminic acid synthetase
LAAAAGLPAVCEILVSTDSSEIAERAAAAGALVPWLRPAELATDTTSMADVALHALDWYERERGRVDGLLLLQPTSPFRRRASIQRGCELFDEVGGERPVIGVSPAASHPMWCYRVHGSSMRPFVDGAGDLRSQDLPPAYVINGGCYIWSPERLRADRAFHGDDLVPLVMTEPGEAIDIDTEWDWTLAEAMVGSGAVRLP